MQSINIILFIHNLYFLIKNKNKLINILLYEIKKQINNFKFNMYKNIYVYNNNVIKLDAPTP
jgi:hypothetical protein